LKIFREGLKQELKSMKQDMEELPKDQRKSSMRVKKQYLDRDQHERVSLFSKPLDKKFSLQFHAVFEPILLIGLCRKDSFLRN